MLCCSPGKTVPVVFDWLATFREVVLISIGGGDMKENCDAGKRAYKETSYTHSQACDTSR